ncbi:cysteine proteinase [Hymenopellis radicata]|nr:cysteine proteinase [Hymenopellis radicata]
MSPRKRSKRKVSNGAEPSTRQRKRHQPDPQDASSEEDSADEKELVRLDTDNVYLRMLADVVYWDVVVSHNLGKNTLAGCFHRLTAHLENQLDVDPTVEDYQNLNNMLLDTLFFCDDVSKLPSPIDHSDLVAALDATHPLIGALRTAKFTLAGDRPRLLQSILSEVRRTALRRIPEITGNRPTLQVQSLERLAEGMELNDEVLNFFVNAWTLIGDPQNLVGETWQGSGLLLDKQGKPLRSLLANSIGSLCSDKTKKSKKNWFNKTSKSAMGTCSRLLLPLNKNRNHWVLVCVDFNTAEFAILDSFVGSDEEYFSQQICGLLEHAVTLLRQNKEDISTPLNLKRIDVQIPQQQNHFDCGIHTLAWMEHLLYGEPFPLTRVNTFSGTQLAQSRRSAIAYRAHFLWEMNSYLKRTQWEA